MSDTENTNSEETPQPKTSARDKLTTSVLTTSVLTTKQYIFKYDKCNTDAPVWVKITSGSKNK